MNGASYLQRSPVVRADEGSGSSSSSLSRSDTVARSTPSASRIDPWLWRSVCKLTPFARPGRRQRKETEAEIVSGLSGVPSGLATIRSRPARWRWSSCYGVTPKSKAPFRSVTLATVHCSRYPESMQRLLTAAPLSVIVLPQASAQPMFSASPFQPGSDGNASVTRTWSAPQSTPVEIYLNSPSDNRVFAAISTARSSVTARRSRAQSSAAPPERFC
jgi:hypothetical protein